VNAQKRQRETALLWVARRRDAKIANILVSAFLRRERIANRGCEERTRARRVIGVPAAVMRTWSEPQVIAQARMLPFGTETGDSALWLPGLARW